MNIAIITNHYDHSKQLGIELRQKLQQQGAIIDDNHPDIVLTIGGDGTLLYAFHHYEHMLSSLRFIGIHTGNLGFYTDWRECDLDELVDALIHEDGQSIDYPLLDVELSFKNCDTIQRTALNEVTIRRINHTVVADIYINDYHFERFRGDGLALSTPTGSTGYNKSLGGAVIPPTLEVFQLTEIAPLNSRVYHTFNSPLILTKEDSVTIRVDQAMDYIVTVDNETYPLEQLESMTISVSKQNIRFMRHRHLPFWQRVSQAFLGDIQ